MSRTLALLLLVGCHGEEGDSAAPPVEAPGERVSSSLARDMDPDVSDEDLAQLTSDNQAFALELLPLITEGDGNLFVSPHSISIALAMTYAGALGDTATQMADAMNFTLPAEVLHPAFNRLDLELATRDELPDDEAYADADPFRLSIVNQLFGQTGLAFQEPFLDTLALNYGADLRLLDFAADPEAQRALINDWVLAATEGRIEDLLPPGSISDMTRLVLANAIYFKASWQTPFESSDTTDAPFALLDGSSATASTMHGIYDGGYASGDGYELVDVPYVGDQLCMTIILPEAGRFADVEAALDSAELTLALDSMTTHQVTMALPKFTFKSEFGLATPLMELGMVDAFDGTKADFSGMTTEADLYISAVYHQAFVGIDEIGTEAAAATAVVMEDTGIPEQVTVDVDRPFLFLVRDRPTGAVLFLGRVTDPTAG